MNPRLEAAVSLMARHAAYSGKDHLSHCCMNEIEGRFRLGQVTGQERARLIGILVGKGEVRRRDEAQPDEFVSLDPQGRARPPLSPVLDRARP